MLVLIAPRQEGGCGNVQLGAEQAINIFLGFSRGQKQYSAPACGFSMLTHTYTPPAFFIQKHSRLSSRVTRFVKKCEQLQVDVFETDVKKTNAHTKKVWKPLTSEEAALPSSIGEVWENPSTGDTQRGGGQSIKGHR